MKGLLPKFSFGLLAVLVLATILLTVGRRETYAQPSVTSYNPSGLHALQEVLQFGAGGQKRGHLVMHGRRGLDTWRRDAAS